VADNPLDIYRALHGQQIAGIQQSIGSQFGQSQAAASSVLVQRTAMQLTGTPLKGCAMTQEEYFLSVG